MFGGGRVRPLLGLLFAAILALSACGGSDSGSGADGPVSDDTEQPPASDSGGGAGDMETVATLTIDGEPYTFVGVKGGSVLNDDFYCFVGTTGGVNARLAQEGDADSELRFILLPDEDDPSLVGGTVTAEIPADFEHTLHDGGQTKDIQVQDLTITGDSFSISATISFGEMVSGTEHEGTLEATC